MKQSELPTTSKSGRPLEVENGRITSVSLSVEDHGCLSGWLSIEFDCSGCGFGGYKLADADGGNLEGKNYAGEFIVRVLGTVGVGRWEKLVGQPVRCLHEGIGGSIVAVGHLFKDKWFCPSLEWEKK